MLWTRANVLYDCHNQSCFVLVDGVVEHLGEEIEQELNLVTLECKRTLNLE